MESALEICLFETLSLKCSPGTRLLVGEGPTDSLWKARAAMGMGRGLIGRICLVGSF